MDAMSEDTVSSPAIVPAGLTLGSRVIGPEPGWECVVAFLGATFSGEPRHQRRLDKVLAIEAAERG